MISPFKMLLMDISVALIAGAFLMFFADKSAGVLWAFTSVLGLFFATINGAVVAWAAKHLPSKGCTLIVKIFIQLFRLLANLSSLIKLT